MAWGSHFEDECRKAKEQREAAANAHNVKHVAHVATFADPAVDRQMSYMRALADLSRD